MVVWLPHFANELFPYDPNAHVAFDEHLVKSNVSILSSIFGKNDKRIAYILNLIEDYSEVLSAIKDARIIQEQSILSGLVGVNYSGRIMRISDFKFLLPNILKEEGTTIFLSDTHTSTAIIIEEICNNKTATDIRLGVVCIDAHADFCNDSLELWKGNTFFYLFAKNFIEAVIVAGVPKFRQLNICSQLSEDMNRRIRMFGDLQEKDEIKSALDWLSEQNVDHVFYSIDIDGLLTRKLKLTATEYCPFHILLNLAKHDWVGLGVDTIEQYLDDAISPPNYQQGGRRNLFCIGDTGLRIEELTEFLGQCFNFLSDKGIKNGVDVNKNIVLGDIVELFGPDFRSNTAKAVVQILKALMAYSQTNFATRRKEISNERKIQRFGRPREKKSQIL